MAGRRNLTLVLGIVALVAILMVIRLFGDAVWSSFAAMHGGGGHR